MFWVDRWGLGFGDKTSVFPKSWLRPWVSPLMSPHYNCIKVSLTCRKSSLTLSPSCRLSPALLLDLHNTASFRNINSDTRAVKHKQVLFSVDQPINTKDGICAAFCPKRGDITDTFKAPAGNSLISWTNIILQMCAAYVSLLNNWMIWEHLFIPGRLDVSLRASWRTSAFWTPECASPGDCESFGWHNLWISLASFPRGFLSCRVDSHATASLLPTTTRSPRRKASHADAWLDRARSAGGSRTAPPDSPRLYTEAAGRLVGGFLVQIFPRHRRTADRAEAEGVEAMVVDNYPQESVSVCGAAADSSLMFSLHNSRSHNAWRKICVRRGTQEEEGVSAVLPATIFASILQEGGGVMWVCL